MADKALPSPEVLRQLIRYEPETGKLFWLERPESMFRSARAWRIWNTQNAHKEALTARNGYGYRHGTVCGVTVTAHRAAWAAFYGEWPSMAIDHANRDKSDNRIINLRLATARENSANKRKNSGCTSKYLGVGFYKQTGKWHARIRVFTKNKHLGFFKSEEEAAAAYDAEAIKVHGKFASLNLVGNVNV